MAVQLLQKVVFLPGGGNQGASSGFCGLPYPWFLAERISKSTANFLGDGVKGVSAVIIIIMLFVLCYFFIYILLFNKEMTIGLPPATSGASLAARGTDHTIIFQPLRRGEWLEMEGMASGLTNVF